MHGPECILWRRMRQNRGGISGMKCCVLDPAHAHPVRTWCKKTKNNNHGTLKHNGYERGDQSFCSCLVLSSQLSHSAPEFDQYVEPDADEAPRNEHERLSKHPGTGTLTYTHTHTHFFSLSCVSLSQPFIALFWSKRLKTQKPTMHTHSGGPPPHPAPRVPFISIMERRKVPAQDCRWHLHQPCIFEGASQSVYPTKFVKAPLLKRRRRKRSCLNNESARWNERRPRCLSEFLQIFTSGGRGSDHRSNMARRTTS